MKFVAIRQNIKDALSVIHHAAADNINLPILKNVLIELENNVIAFTATNLEIAIKSFVSGKIIENGRITVPVSLLSNIITNLQTDRLNFESKENNLEVKTENYNAVIQGMPADDFPITPKIKDLDSYIEIKAIFLKEAIQQTTVASQFSDLRPELNSILFDFSLESIKIAATDGFRLAEKTIPANVFTAKKSEPFRVLIPLRTTQELSRILMNDEDIRIYHDENQILFKTEKMELISRLNEGSFPDYSGLIPEKFVLELTISQEEFENALKLTNVFSQKNNEVSIIVHPNKKAVEITSADQSYGENKYVLPAKIKGEQSERMFNIKYLTDALKSVSGDEVFLGIQEEANPALIKSPSDSSYFYILKPIVKA
ncbi:MAG: DNA polymerase III subunit beta [Patescibacteria group bacterium]|nr:DNA polymerase III subunit beta [Patescibacteria group bacterium]